MAPMDGNNLAILDPLFVSPLQDVPPRHEEPTTGHAYGTRSKSKGKTNHANPQEDESDIAELSGVVRTLTGVRRGKASGAMGRRH